MTQASISGNEIEQEKTEKALRMTQFTLDHAVEPTAFIIEDDDKISRIFAAALQSAQYETEIIQDGQVALDRLAKTIPNIIVLDLHLPNVMGVDILRQLRADERFAATRVMVVTADSALGNSVKDEVDLMLLKPIGFSQLRDLATHLRPT